LVCLLNQRSTREKIEPKLEHPFWQGILAVESRMMYHSFKIREIVEVLGFFERVVYVVADDDCKLSSSLRDEGSI